jgi:glycosyltransferase involved in cell wall biosynthesis
MSQSIPRTPEFSLIVPTRRRTAMLRQLLESLVHTARDPAGIEIILVVDADDSESRAFRFERLAVRRVVVSPGLTMGALNRAGYEASSGRFLMLLNDDVLARTRKWDRTILSCLSRHPDGIVLVHTNDQLFQTVLCTFPILSRTFCELAGGICPADYVRYRIDDHIEDIFNLLWILGEPRTTYLPDVVFEHKCHAPSANGEKHYVLDEAALALDAARFLECFGERKELALRLKRRIAGQATAEEEQDWRARLERIQDPFSLRVSERLRVERETLTWGRWVERKCHRIQQIVRTRGYQGLARVVWRRIAGQAPYLRALFARAPAE